MPEFTGNESTLVPGRIRGHRIWDTRCSQGSYYLDSWSAKYTWIPGVNEATCQANYVHEEPSPVKNCTCGFYARYRLSDFTDYYMDSYLVYGVVDAWGKVQLGTMGFRAQYARIVAIAPFNPISYDTWEKTAENYGAILMSDVHSLEEAYPPPDLSDLIPEIPTEPTYTYTVPANTFSIGKVYSVTIYKEGS